MPIGFVVAKGQCFGIISTFALLFRRFYSLRFHCKELTVLAQLADQSLSTAYAGASGASDHGQIKDAVLPEH
jgi:hypothetical protein